MEPKGSEVKMPEEQEKEIDFDSAEENVQQNMEEMGVEDFESNYIPHPKVDEEIELSILKTYKDKNVKAKTKDGKPFSTALSGVEFKYTIETDNNKKYSPSSWEVWGKIRAILKEKVKEGKFNKEKKEFVPPVKVRVKHVRDGMKHKDKEPNYVVEEIK